MTNTTHIMLDLETWGTRPGCDIRSIGAVVFYPETTGDVTVYSERTFYVATENPMLTVDDPITGYEKYQKYRMLTRDPETVKWWQDQSPEAQAAFVNPIELRDACLQFAVWLESLNSVAPVPRYPDATYDENVRIWTNGPHFDIAILDAVYHAVGLPVPWHYRAPRDFRTITEAAGMTRDDLVKPTVSHHALHDAIAQAQGVCEAYKRLGLTNG